MAVGGVLATALNDTTVVRAKGLYLGGTDVLLAPGTGGNRTGVPIETVHVSEAGPGGVSSMEFVVEDPTITATVSDGMDVRFMDIAADTPLFYGWVQSWDIRPAFGNQGRTITVQAQGVETVLDWGVTTVDLVFAAGVIGSTEMPIQSIVANATGVGPIRTQSRNGSLQAQPIDSQAATNPYAFTIPAGTTVREAIRLAMQAMNYTYLATVDFTYGLRFFASTTTPNDYNPSLAIVNIPTGTAQSENLDYASDSAGIVRRVWVHGLTQAFVISDGTNLPGPTAVIENTAWTTGTMLNDAGNAYLTQFQTGVRGSYNKVDWAPPSTTHVAGYTTITDARVGLSAASFRIMQIDKTFNPSGRQNWTVVFGGLPPSGARLIRRLTRTVLN